jgi:tetratricopeptide (TPR) repeat protein
MTELTGPEEMDLIYDCVKPKDEIKTWNKFQRTFRSLQTLSLIVETSGRWNRKEYDLHPMVRNFILSEYPDRREREPFLDGVIWAIDIFIGKFGGTISFATPMSDLEYYIMKAELALRKEDFETAIMSLVKVGENLVQGGVPGELFRVGESLLAACEGRHQKFIDLNEFHELNDVLGRGYADYGRKEEAHNHINRYSRLIPKETAQYIAVCNAACYVEWMFRDYEQAISWGKEGVRLKTESNIDTHFDTSYHLALAQRDSGDVNTALKYFLNGQSAEEALKNEIKEDARAARFGNIGRCLQLQEEYEWALRFFVKSACLLEKDEDSNSILNRGYAATWIGEILEKQGNYNSSYIAYRRAEIIWSKRAPLRVSEPHFHAIEMSKLITDQSVLGLTEAGIERAFKEQLHQLQKC